MSSSAAGFLPLPFPAPAPVPIPVPVPGPFPISRGTSTIRSSSASPDRHLRSSAGYWPSSFVRSSFASPDRHLRSSAGYWPSPIIRSSSASARVLNENRSSHTQSRKCLSCRNSALRSNAFKLQQQPHSSIAAPRSRVLARDKSHIYLKSESSRPTLSTSALSMTHDRTADANVEEAEMTSGLEGSDVSELVEEALTWSSLNGLLVGDADGEGSGARPGLGMVHAPVTLVPTPFPAPAFFKAYALAPHFNELVDAVSQDREFLRSTLASAALSDPFTAALLDIHARTEKEDALKTVRLGMHRSDYMLDTAGGDVSTVLQVELNTIASSFPGLSSRVSALHRHCLSKGLYSSVPNLTTEAWRLPPNPAAVEMAGALAAAWRASQSHPSAVVLVVVQPNERNLYDQKWLEQELWERYQIRSIRRTLAEVEAQGELRGPQNQLNIDGQLVSIVYYRAGYAPTDYPSQKEWDARLLMEQSSAISCPSISYHLTGSKKVQQKLAEPGCLERFVHDPDVATQIRSCFAGLWSLECAEGDVPKAVADALAEPEIFVLKPQREGGGNNIYGADVRAKIEELLGSSQPQESLAAYILMQRIQPPVQRALMMRKGNASWVESLSELGIYSVFVRTSTSVLLNKAAGHLLRTKTATSDEGGVATGYAVLDSPYLL